MKNMGLKLTRGEKFRQFCIKCRKESTNKLKKYSTIGVCLCIWIIFTVLFLLYTDDVVHYVQVIIPTKVPKDYHLTNEWITSRAEIFLNGPFLINEKSNDKLVVTLLANNTEVADEWIIYLPSVDKIESTVANVISNSFEINDIVHRMLNRNIGNLTLRMQTNIDQQITVGIDYDLSVQHKTLTIVIGAIILIVMYIFIIWEIVHRTFAALLASTLALAVLGFTSHRPELKKIVEWVDMETILLLFSMMIMVSIIAQSGIFDYFAVFAFKKTRGNIWPMLNLLIIITATISLILDNVTTIMLMTPVIIRISEVVNLDPVPVLTIVILFCNISGVATAVGDPPNLMIASNSFVQKSGISFLQFTIHMGIGTICCMLSTYGQIRFVYRNLEKLSCKKPKTIQIIEHDITMWKKAKDSMATFSMEDLLVEDILEKRLNELNVKLKSSEDDHAEKKIISFNDIVADLEAKYPIRDKALLIKSIIVIVFVIVMFCLHSLPHFENISFGWAAFLAVVLLIIISDRSNSIENCLSMVEWSTLLFFAALFVLMECLAELGLIVWMGETVAHFIVAVSPTYRLTVSILLVLWFSGLCSAFVDNIPLTTMMLKIVIGLVQNKSLDLPLQPLLWALAFGGGFGGNGTLIGSSSNIVCAGVASQHGYQFSFNSFFKIGFPVMIGSLIIASVYLVVCHVLLKWN